MSKIRRTKIIINMTKLVVAVVILIGHAAGAQGQLMPSNAEPIIVLEHFHTKTERILNTTPHYQIEIFANGNSVYRGFQFVRDSGPIIFQLSAVQIQHIVDVFERSGFWEMQPEYRVEGFGKGIVGGGPWLNVTLRWRGRSKSVSFDAFSNSGGQLFLDAVEREANSKRWRCPFIIRIGNEELDA